MKKANTIMSISTVEKKCALMNYSKYVFFSIILISFFSTAHSQTKKITIDPSETFQKIENFTASDAWSGNFVGKNWDEKQKSKIAEWLFSQQFDMMGNPAGIGLSMWRVNVGAGTFEQDGADIMPLHRRAESFMTKDGQNYDWEKCVGHQYFMQKAVEHGCNNFLLFSNSPLVQYTKNGKGWSALENEANIKPGYYSKFANYLADVTTYFIEKKGWNISYISPINEPQVNWDSPRQEGSPWRSFEMKKMYEELDKSLSKNKLDNVKILVGETAAYKYLLGTSTSLSKRFPEGNGPGYQIKNFFDPKSTNYIGNLKHVPSLIAGHSYHSHLTNTELKETRKKVKTEVDKYGIDFHQTEWCLLPNSNSSMDGFSDDWQPVNNAGIQAALLLGRLIYGDFVYAGSKAWGYWKGMEVKGNYALISLYPTTGDLLQGGAVRTNKLLWALGNYSFFIRPDYSRIQLRGADDLDAMVASAYLAPDDSRIVAVYVNSSFDTIPVRVSFSDQWNEKIKKVSAFKTDDRSDLANMYVNKGFSQDKEYVIPPRSLVTLVFDF